MVRKTYLFCFLVLYIVFGKSIQNNVFVDNAVRTNSLPTTSCLQIKNVKSKLCCFSTCLMKMNYFYMFSHTNRDHLCVCCDERTGSELSGTNWKTYIPAPCPGGYTSYLYEYYEVCLKYVDTGKKYPDAVKHCNEDGGDLIRLDSQKKYDMFKADLAQHAAQNTVQVWVQGEKHRTTWKFHDGTPIPNVCHMEQSNGHTEIHFRYRSYSKSCADAPPSDTYHYMCEIYRRFSFHN